MAELWVGAGKQYASISAAYNAAKSGDTIYVVAGTYNDQSVSITRDVNIVGVGGMAHFHATKAIPNGKAIFVTTANVTFENIEFSGAQVADANGAGIRYQGGNLTVKNSYFHDNQNGILAAADPDGVIAIRNSEFARNGAGDGQTHGIYINQIAKLSVTDSYFHDTDVGHHIKSRAAFSEVRNSTLDDGSNDASYNIDLPDGGSAVIVGNTLIQSAITENRVMVNYGGEANPPKPGSVLVEDNTFINYRDQFGVAVNNRTTQTIELKDNTFFNVHRVAEGGPIDQVGNITGVLGSSGADVIGTTGLDKIDYRFSPGAVEVDLAAGVAFDGYGATDQLDGVEHAGGSRFADVLTGDAKANRLDGGDGADRLSGGAGDDWLKGGGGNDVIAGGDGTDTAVFSGASSDYSVTLSGDEVIVEAMNGRPEGVDRLTGVEKLQFADRLADSPAASANAAPTAANDEASTPFEQAVTLDVLANDGDADGDSLTIASVGSAQHGAAVAKDGKIVYTPVAGFAGTDSFSYRASDGNGGYSTATAFITVEPELSSEPPVAYDGKVIVGTNSSQNMYGSSLADFLQGNGGNDSMWGYAGNDRLDGGDGADRLYAGDGDDLLIGGAGNDVLDGGAGVDLAVYAGNAADYKVTASASGIAVEALVGPDGVDQLYGVEQIRFADKSIDAATGIALEQDGGSEPPPPVNTAPAAKNDTAIVESGRSVAIDVLANDSDADGDALSISGIAVGPANGSAAIVDGKIVYTPAAGYVGSDALSYQASDGKGGFSTATATVTVEEALPSEPVAYDGKVIVGTNGSQNMYGSSRADFLQGNGGNDSMWGYAGNDRLDGGDGADRLYAGDGRDLLIGGAGNDVLMGDGGDDLLDGGSGDDRLTGGAGDDMFIFQAGCGTDAITDFLASGADRIDLQAFDLDGFATLKAMCVDNGADVSIDLAGADSVTLLGARLAELSANHFLL